MYPERSSRVFWMCFAPFLDTWFCTHFLRSPAFEVTFGSRSQSWKMKPMPSMIITRSARAALLSARAGSREVSNENARMNTFACCWATKSCSRLTGSRLLSFTPRSQPARPALPGEQQGGTDETGDDAEKVERAETHQTVEWVGVGERSERSHIGM